MIYIFDASGNVLRCLPERIYQGSSETSRLTVIAPYSENTQLSVAFCLTTGESTPRQYMQFIGEIPDVSVAEGLTMYVWRMDIPALVTARYGTVFAQFYGVGPQGEVSASARVSFTVERGVERELPDWSSEDSFDQVLSVISSVLTNVKNAAYAARALFAWNEAFVYSYNEIVFCPEAGNHGTFVRSLVTENDRAPYLQDNVLNSAYWEEVCCFDDVFEQAEAAAEAKDDAAAYASEASASKTAASGYADAAAQSAQQAEEAKQSAAADAQQAAQDSQTATEAAEEAAQSAASAASSAQQSAASQTAAAQSATEAASSKQAAAGSATEATSAKESASTYASEASASKTAASGYADAAAQSAQQAEEAKQSAAADAQQAAQDSQTAAEAAEEAAQSAASAAASAQEASEIKDAVLGENVAMKSDLDKLIDGTQKVAAASNADNATHADSADNAAHADSADEAVHADSADKAVQDGGGNIIASTYSTQAALSSEISARQSADTTLQNNINAKYTKPSGGIPESDLSTGIRASLDKADTAFQVPSNMVIGEAVSNPQPGTYIDCTMFVSLDSIGNYYFVNCAGSITISGTSCFVNIANSPNLTVNGITSSNWRNVYIDGVAKYKARTASISLPSAYSGGYTTVASNVQSGDTVEIAFRSYENAQKVYTFRINESSFKFAQFVPLGVVTDNGVGSGNYGYVAHVNYENNTLKAGMVYYGKFSQDLSGDSNLSCAWVTLFRRIDD